MLRRADHPAAIAAALGLSAKQTSYEAELSRLQRRYSFIFTEKAQPTLHQEVRHFLRLWLLERQKEPEIAAVNMRLKDAHEADLKHLEAHIQYISLDERLQDEEWIGTYLDLTEQQFWLDSVEGIRYMLPFMIAASIFRRDINEDAVAVGTFFEAEMRLPYSQWWTWATQGLVYQPGRRPTQEELAGLEALTQFAEERCPSFPQWLPDYRKELEAALWWRLGAAYRRTDSAKALVWYEKAITRLEKQAQLKKDAARVAWNLADKLAEEKKYTERLPFLNRAIELDPNYANAYTSRGITYGILKEYPRAIQDLDRAIELDPNYATAYRYRGYVYLWLKNISQARTDYEHSYELASTNINGAWMIEWIKMNRRRIDVEGAARLETIAAIDLESYTACICRGIALGLRGKGKEGLEEVERAISLSPDNWSAYFWKGMLCAYYYQGGSHGEELITAIEQSLAKELPPILLTPLYWLEKDRPEVFVKYAKPLLERYGI